MVRGKAIEVPDLSWTARQATKHSLPRRFQLRATTDEVC
jgi:hypothetical protein